MNHIGALILALALCACGQPDIVHPGEAQLRQCAAAAAHLSICASASLPVAMQDCALSDAEVILGSSCEELQHQMTDSKADGGWLATMACRLGFYSQCAQPACQERADEWPKGLAPCTQWLQFDGCAICQYYACRERVSQCGADGYLVGYVGRYCGRFATVTEPRVSPQAQRWLTDVRRCLIETLESDVPYDASCSDIETRGIASHAECYLKIGFCELDVVDWLAIVHSIGAADIPLRSVLTTGHGCLRQWLKG